MKNRSAEELIEFGKQLGQKLTVPAVIELIGDVGTGKTTLTRGIALGLGVAEEVTSPSFTIAKRYHFARQKETSTLVHYDFYRLPDPGIMTEELMETLQDPQAVTVIEWGESVAGLLPSAHTTIYIELNDDGSRSVTLSDAENASD